jgi:hypothetical protein
MNTFKRKAEKLVQRRVGLPKIRKSNGISAAVATSLKLRRAP